MKITQSQLRKLIRESILLNEANNGPIRRIIEKFKERRARAESREEELVDSIKAVEKEVREELKTGVNFREQSGDTFYFYYIGPEYDDSSTLTIKHGVPFASARFKIKGDDAVDFDGYVFPVPSDSPALTDPGGLYDAIEDIKVEEKLKGTLETILPREPLVKREGGYVCANTKQSVVKSKKSEGKGENKFYVHALKKVGSKELMDKIFELPKNHKIYNEFKKNYDEIKGSYAGMAED
jgi:hypothetical protein